MHYLSFYDNDHKNNDTTKMISVPIYIIVWILRFLLLFFFFIRILYF